MLLRFTVIALLSLFSASAALASDITSQIDAGDDATVQKLSNGPSHRGGKASPYATPYAKSETSPAARRAIARAELDVNGPSIASDKGPAARRAIAKAELDANGPAVKSENASPASRRAVATAELDANGPVTKSAKGKVAQQSEPRDSVAN